MQPTQNSGRQLASFGDPALRDNLLFYFAISPSQFGEVVEQVHKSGLLKKDGPGWQRLVVEKPFGHDLASAQELNKELTRYAHESQVFRIDHYLGKETVQNILMFRFSNSIFERLWTRESVDFVQLTVSEKIGVGDRGGLLRGGRRASRHGAESYVAGAFAHRDGAACIARSRSGAR